jgi:small subunit ribosomal protein S20
MVQNAKRNAVNIAAKSEIHTTSRKFDQAIESKSKEDAQTILSYFYKIIDKAISRGVLKKATGARKKSRHTKRLNALQKA